VLASMPSVSRLVGTPSISSAFWMGLIRCDCPDASKGGGVFFDQVCYTIDAFKMSLKRSESKEYAS
jgi:hypothetical protein